MKTNKNVKPGMLAITIFSNFCKAYTTAICFKILVEEAKRRKEARAAK